MDISQQCQAMRREAQLGAAQIASGVTALGRANHARPGDYTNAFFGLATGLERLGKLIAIGDYAISNGGKFPNNDFLKVKFHHDLDLLLNHCDRVSRGRSTNGKYPNRPNDNVHQGIVKTLSEFGKQTRYYNLDLLVGGQTAGLQEPVGAWWNRVGAPILSKHYTARQREIDIAVANFTAELLGPHSFVLHHSETGELMTDAPTLFQRAGATRVIQRYGRLYVLQIVRWLSFLIADLASEAAYIHNIEPFLGIEEPFKLFRNDDRYFRRRKCWSIPG